MMAASARRVSSLGLPPRQPSNGQVFIPCPPRLESQTVHAWADVLDLGLEARAPSLHPHLMSAFREINAKRGPPAPHVQKKISAGVVLVRTPDMTFRAKDKCGGRREYQAVVVKGRITYAFGEFVQGNYDPQNAATVRQLIHHMTVEERLTVHSLDFDRMWERISVRDVRPSFSWRTGGPNAYDRLRIHLHGWKSYQGDDFQYAKRRDKFREAWMRSEADTQRLRKMLCAADGAGESRWEFPKGKRLSVREPDVSCAIREFCEETSIPARAFTIVPDFARVDMYMHMGVLYIATYYLAVLTEDIPHPEQSISLRNGNQVPEVVNVTWMGTDMLRRVNGPVGRDLSIVGRQAFQAARNFVRGASTRPMCLAPDTARRKKKRRRRDRSEEASQTSCAQDDARAIKSAPREQEGVAPGQPAPLPGSDGAAAAAGGDEWQVVTHGKKCGRPIRRPLPPES